MLRSYCEILQGYLDYTITIHMNMVFHPVVKVLQDGMVLLSRAGRETFQSQYAIIPMRRLTTKVLIPSINFLILVKK